MVENRNVTEPHGCVVCGRTYNMLVVYSPSGEMVDCTVTTSGGRRLPDPKKPMVACTTHTEAEIQSAQARKIARDAADRQRDAKGDD